MKLKGSFFDLITAPILLIFIVICIYASYTVWAQFNSSTAFQQIIGYNNNTQTAWTSTQTALAFWDYVFFIVAIGLMITTIVSAYYLSSNPGLFWASFLLGIILIPLSTVFQNVYSQIYAQPQFLQATFVYTLIFYYWNNFLIFQILTWGISSIVLYSGFKKARPY